MIIKSEEEDEEEEENQEMKIEKKKEWEIWKKKEDHPKIEVVSTSHAKKSTSIAAGFSEWNKEKKKIENIIS